MLNIMDRTAHAPGGPEAEAKAIRPELQAATITTCGAHGDARRGISWVVHAPPTTTPPARPQTTARPAPDPFGRMRPDPAMPIRPRPPQPVRPFPASL